MTKEQINLTLALPANRKIDTGHSIRLDNKFYQLTDEYGKPVHFYQGTEALIIKALDQNMYTAIND